MWSYCLKCPKKYRKEKPKSCKETKLNNDAYIEIYSVWLWKNRIYQRTKGFKENLFIRCSFVLEVLRS